MRLSERSSLWNAKPENRHLPSALEWANIRLLTKKKDWTGPQRKMMKRAGRVHGVRGFVAVLLLVGAACTGLVIRNNVVENNKLITQAKESNRFAARSLAERVALEVESRWVVLETESDDPGLMRLLAAPPDSPEGRDRDGSVRRRIADRLAYWNNRFSQPIAANYWFAADHNGLLRTLSPYMDALIGRYYGYRDYFHGLGHELKPGDPRPRSITRPQRSHIYLSTWSNTLAVTFIVPVRGPAARRRPPIGILAMETEAGHFTKFRGSRDQSSVLIDLRPDADGRTGRVIAHPQLPAMELRSPGRASTPHPRSSCVPIGSFTPGSRGMTRPRPTPTR